MLKFQVKDMTCGHCVRTITAAVAAVDGAAVVTIDLAAHQVSVAHATNPRVIEETIRDAGYTPMKLE